MAQAFTHVAIFGKPRAAAAIRDRRPAARSPASSQTRRRCEVMFDARHARQRARLQPRHARLRAARDRHAGRRRHRARRRRHHARHRARAGAAPACR
ncbi:MAG: hypothetical protein MZW92_01895 [Comamonadaceae bacterium]|nr:hypothetical protein [Comamonadaceae bacterium]